MKKLFLILCIISIATIANAQKTSGDISCLKGQNQINITFDYQGVTYDGESESNYFKNEEKAKKEDWRTAWTSSFRTDKWEPRLVKDLNKEISKKNMECGDFPDAPYTIIVKLVDIDPGTFAGPMSVPAKVTANAIIVKTGSDSALGTIELKKITYSGYFLNPLPELRVGEAFSCVGETIGKKLSKIK
jgi:hypothetical protein